MDTKRAETADKLEPKITPIFLLFIYVRIAKAVILC